MDPVEVVVNKTYKHPISKVWDAITNQKSLKEWFVPGSFKAEPGFAYSFKNEYTYVRGEVLQVTPPTLLVYTWIKEDTDIETTVRWELEEVNGYTNLTITHTGIEKYSDDMANRNQEGWNYVISAIEQYLATTNE